MPNALTASVTRIVTTRKVHPVLMDVGASGETLPEWEPIAAQSRYVGFDPDCREMREISDGRFQKATIVNEAVTAESGSNSTTFFLTRSPYCSSTLRPNTEALSKYVFADLFSIEREVVVPATTLNDVVTRLQLPGIDWLKLDSQGTDLRLYQSLADKLRKRLLVIDVEPGLIDAYHGEDLFVDVHATLMQDGFWLSNLSIEGVPRISRKALAEALHRRSALNETDLRNAFKPSPGWCEARYVRSLESLAQHEATERDYLLLWVFALLNHTIGFAFEVGLEFERRFPDDADANVLAAETLRLMPTGPPLATRFKRMIPATVRRALKRLLQLR
jgi:FkbM family methyltransferase